VWAQWYVKAFSGKGEADQKGVIEPPPPSTRSSFLSSLLSPFLNKNSHPNLPSFLHPTGPTPTNLHEILLSTRSMMGYLDRFGIWDMQRCGVKLEHTPGGDDDEVELVLGLRERGRMFLKAGTEVGGGEGGGVGSSFSMTFAY
jgi:outer membrane protein insertion porin family